jgi:hypothetical protein
MSLSPITSLIIVLCSFSLSLKGQIIKMTKSELLTDETLHWYGIDFSNIIIFDETQVGKAEKVKQSIFIEWQAYFNKHVSDNKLKKRFRKSELIDHRKKFYQSHENLNLQTFIQGNYSSSNSSDKHVQEILEELAKDDDSKKSLYQPLSMMQLDSCVKSYDLQESGGLGAIMIVEKMSKLDKKSYVTGILFDISSREILFCARRHGVWDSYGFVALYGSGINDAIIAIGDEFRRKALKQFR